MLKYIVKAFPANKVRLLAMKACGYFVGEKVYIGPELIISTSSDNKTAKIYLGDRVSIGPRVTFILASDANWSKLTERYKPIRKSIEVGDDSWIGAGVIILPGVKIGSSSIIASGAVVTTDVPSNCVFGGVPAKFIKQIGDE
ncbi:MAG: acyltransferase [Paludibacter sp.]